MKTPDENTLFNQLKQGDEKAFELLFNTYYSSLCLFAHHYLNDQEKAEEIVQELFVNLWSKRKKLNIDNSVKNYLFRSVRNQCLNQIQHRKIKDKHAQFVKENFSQEVHESDYFLEVGLSEKIEASIESLPEKRKQIFKLSREQGLKYKEIAQQLGVSVKTVETQMGLALKQLREKLKDYKDYFIIGLHLLKKKLH
ncbi:RNA polymerase sigma-70 factor [Sunxiuqinia elliptica]|uniref:RNA polymerase sigma-70 factor, ECF subfamily n=1 Tax=Sunxiuqinia elliptica TaxID=655355 RepID=A0A1I2AXQ8_9BACT|nr:RNA polymerase sigma-70 factor [Sunxiuqinia elliptica]SFE48549.1 RNA polymerase sigma-70 factor, ECF subfamily [Sunxiuqinia elliptica]